jgi:hypothetical protein
MAKSGGGAELCPPTSFWLPKAVYAIEAQRPKIVFSLISKCRYLIENTGRGEWI